MARGRDSASEALVSARAYRRGVSALRKGADPDGKAFTWRGIEFQPPDASDPTGFYSAAPIEVADDRTAEWKVHKPKTAWHARLRIGSERYPGVGTTAVDALEDAAREAANVATYIVAMLPAARELAAPAKRTRTPTKSRKGAG